MEHRYHTRRTVGLELVIFHRPLGLVRGVATNISTGGLFVDTGAVMLPMDAVVELGFVAGSRRPRELHRLLAIVAHTGRRGAGLMYCEPTTQDTARLLEAAQQRLDAA